MRMTHVSLSSPPVASSMGIMSCVRNSSPPMEPAPPPEMGRQESKRKRFNPLLSGLRRIFGKKSRTSSNTSAPDVPGLTLGPGETSDPMRSRSTSQLSETALGGDAGPLKNRNMNSTHLSVSHDSVFTAESPTSEVDATSCLSMQQTAQSSVRAELLDVMRRRKLQREDSDEEDLGLPRSPLSTSPHHKISTNHNHSTCSEGSLLSMGSSELEDENMCTSQSRLTITHDSDAELNISVTLPSVPKLSHSAAKHKMAIRPKRTHGAPRKRKHQIASVTTPLPATPEVNEDTSSARTALSDTEDPSSPTSELTKGLSTEQLNKATPSCVKSSSLPAGALPPSSLCLTRSRSNASPSVKPALSDDQLRKQDASFFSRLLMRRSGKKKKCEDALPPVIPHKRMDEKGNYLVDMNNITSKQYPSSRQRMEPLNIPLEENAVNRMHVSYVTSLPADELDSIQVVHPEPYLLRMYAGEFTPAQFTYQQTADDASSVTTPDIHSAPESTPEDGPASVGIESQDVLVDETVIENIAPQSPRTESTDKVRETVNMSDFNNEAHEIINTSDCKHTAYEIINNSDFINKAHDIVGNSDYIDKAYETINNSYSNNKAHEIVDNSDHNPKAYEIINNSDYYNTTHEVVNKSDYNNKAHEMGITSDCKNKAHEVGNTSDYNNKAHKIVNISDCKIKPHEIGITSDFIKKGHEIDNTSDYNTEAHELGITSDYNNKVHDVVSADNKIVISHKSADKPPPPQRPVACVIPVRPASQVSKVFVNNSAASLDATEKKADTRDRIQHLSLNLVDSVNHGKESITLKDSHRDYVKEPSPRRSIPSSPLRESPLTQRSPLRELSPLPSPFLSKRCIPSPRTPRREAPDFFSDHLPLPESQVLETATRVKEIPSPVIPKDLILPVQSPSKVKESAFTKEIPSPIMPKDVFQFNTAPQDSRIEKSASYTELKKDIPIPAPRISLRKDNSLPTMPEYMKVHVTTQEKMSSSCESLDMQDQVQSSSYSDSCDSMDNIDQWRNKKKEIPWRNRYSEVSSSDSDDKQLSITPDSSDIEKKMEEEISIVQLRRKSFTKDWTLSQETSPPRALRQKSLEPELLKKDSSTNLNEVVLRRKSLSKEMIKNSGESDEPELLKVFARRSLKIPKDFDVNDNSVDFTNVKIVAKDTVKDASVKVKDAKVVSKDSDKENDAAVTGAENINIKQHFALDNEKLKLKKNYESIVITTKNLDNEEKPKAQQKELIKPFSGIKANMNEKNINNTLTVVKTLNINAINANAVADKTLNVKTDKGEETVQNETSSNEGNVAVDNMKGFKKIQQRREEWEQRMQQARKTP